MRLLTDEREFLGIILAIVLSFGLLYHLIDPGVFLITAVTGITVAVIGLVPLFLTGSNSTSFRLAFLSLFLLFVVPLGYAAVHIDWTLLSPISLVLLVALAFVFFYYSVFFPLAFLHIRQRDPECEPEYPYPMVSIIIPAYNEESCIGASIQALQESDYPTDKKEIIIVDDGSTDETYEQATEQTDQTVTILQKPNGGKYTALNLGLEHASGGIIVTVDADSLLEEDTLKTIVGSFQKDPSLGAIAGNLTGLFHSTRHSVVISGSPS
jgi:membrane glycosyltransferase